jgi:uncharacterized phage protein (TIGR01671 family)
MTNLIQKQINKTMNREIKFRVWDGKWMWYPETVTPQGSRIYVTFYYEERSICWDLFDKTGDRWASGKHHNIMQHAGLKDENGKEIYEGDVINFSFDGVLFIQCGTYVKFEDGAFLVHKKNFSPLLSDCKSIEVVGNICENPKLLNYEEK